MTAPENIVDYHELMQVKRDICLFYHEQADYCGIMGDLAYSTLYNLPYWYYLTYDGSSGDQEFVRNGCLVLILAMTWDQIDGSGWYIKGKIEACLRYISYLEPDSTDTIRLIDTVKMALTAAAGGEQQKALETESKWVFERYVRGYFQGRLDGIDNNPYCT